MERGLLGLRCARLRAGGLRLERGDARPVLATGVEPREHVVRLARSLGPTGVIGREVGLALLHHPPAGAGQPDLVALQLGRAPGLLRPADSELVGRTTSPLGARLRGRGGLRPYARERVDLFGLEPALRDPGVDRLEPEFVRWVHGRPVERAREAVDDRCELVLGLIELRLRRLRTLLEPRLGRLVLVDLEEPPQHLVAIGDVRTQEPRELALGEEDDLGELRRVHAEQVLDLGRDLGVVVGSRLPGIAGPLAQGDRALVERGPLAARLRAVVLRDPQNLQPTSGDRELKLDFRLRVEGSEGR
ncbi:MAG: hypothetical protein PGN13_09105 [Patulibacter minatonensis]